MDSAVCIAVPLDITGRLAVFNTILTNADYLKIRPFWLCLTTRHSTMNEKNMKEKLSIVYRNVDDLIPYERNARTHSDEQIEQVVNSIKEFGWTNPILIDSEKGVIAGHGRLLAAKKMGLEQVPTIELSGLTEAQKRAYILADNQLALQAGWDEELLKIEIGELEKELDFDHTILGFTADDLSRFLDSDPLGDDSEDDGEEEVVNDDPPDPPKEAKTKPGDIYILGSHRLMCGDATSIADVARLAGITQGGGARLLLTDPPYNVGYVGKTKESLTIENDKQDDGNFLSFLVRAFRAANGIMLPGAVFYIWFASASSQSFRTACAAVNWKVSEELIWNKSHMVLGRHDYHYKHEPCLYGWKEGAAHAWYSDRSQTTVLDFDRPTKNLEHPTMKPVDLFAYLIRNSSKPGDVVLDVFGGSGTTLIACEQTGRTCLMMELDPIYCDVIVERWQALTGLKAFREDGSEF